MYCCSFCYTGVLFFSSLVFSFFFPPFVLLLRLCFCDVSPSSSSSDKQLLCHNQAYLFPPHQCQVSLCMLHIPWLHELCSWIPAYGMVCALSHHPKIWILPLLRLVILTSSFLSLPDSSCCLLPVWAASLIGGRDNGCWEQAAGLFSAVPSEISSAIAVTGICQTFSYTCSAEWMSG